MTCHEIEEHLADYLGGELGAEDRSRFEAHLAACPACRREAESLGGTLEALRNLPSVNSAEAERRVSVLEVRRRPAGVRGMVWRVLPYAACLAVGVGAGFLSSRPPASNEPASGAVTSLAPSHAAAEGVVEDIHPTWVAAARDSQVLQDAATPIPPSFALLAGISSRGRGGKK